MPPLILPPNRNKSKLVWKEIPREDANLFILTLEGNPREDTTLLILTLEEEGESLQV